MRVTFDTLLCYDETVKLTFSMDIYVCSVKEFVLCPLVCVCGMLAGSSQGQACTSC